MVHFTEVGSLHAPASFAHMAFYVNTTLWLAHCDQLLESATNSSDWWMMSAIAEVCDDLEDLPGVHRAVARPKRQIAAIFGSLFGGVLLARLLFPGNSALVHRVDGQGRRIRALENKMRLFSERLSSFEKRVGTELDSLALTVLHQSELGILTDHKNALAHLIDAAMDGRLAHGFFRRSEIDAAIEAFHKALHNKAFEAPMLQASSIHELRASFASDHDGFFVYVHVPCTPKNTPPYTLFRYQRQPLAMPNSTTYLEVLSRADYLAVSTSAASSSAEITAEELRHCTHFGLHYFCDNVRVFSQTFAASCLGAIYIADVAAVRANCFYRFSSGEFRVATLNDTAIRVNPRSAEPYTVLWQCAGYQRRATYSGQVTLATNNSCVVQIANVSYDSRRVDVSLGFHSSFDWPAATARSAHALEREFAQLAEAAGPVSLDEAQLALPCDVPGWHLGFNGGVALLLMAAVAYCIFAYVRERRKAKNNTG